MAFTNIVAGNGAIASVIMANFRHVNFGSNLLPVDTNGAGVNNTINLGSTAFRYANTYSVLGNFSGAVTMSSTLNVTGSLTVDTTTLFVDPTNNRVGVGTITPSTTFHMLAASGGVARFENDAAASSILLWDTTNGSIGTIGQARASLRFQVTASASVKLTFGAGGSVDQMILSTAGYLGIGIDPVVPLHINTGSQAGGSYGTAATGLKIESTNDGSSISGGIAWVDTDSGLTETFGIYQNRATAATSMVWTWNQSEILRLNATGGFTSIAGSKWGVGVAADVTLHINSGSQTGGSYGDAGCAFKIQSTNDGSSISGGIVWKDSDSGLGETWGIYQNRASSATAMVWTWNASEVIRFASSGTITTLAGSKIGIGITPLTAVHVNCGSQTGGSYGDAGTGIKIEATNDATSVYGGIVWKDTDSGLTETWGVYMIRASSANTMSFTHNQTEVMNIKVGGVTITGTASITSTLGVTGISTLTGGADLGGTGATLKVTVLSIGDWNMDSTNTVSVAHGLTFSKIRGISVIIIDDAATGYIEMVGYDISGVTTTSANVYATATNIVLTRAVSGAFDNASYDATSYNRGYIMITHIA